jgi:ferredoxin-NADP reductase
VQADPRRGLDRPAIEPHAARETEPHDADDVLDLEGMGEERVAHVVAGRVVQFGFLHAENRAWATPPGARSRRDRHSGGPEGIAMLLRIRSVTYLAAEINGYELVDPRGRDLPRFEAGAHIAVRPPNGLTRDYSLWNDPAERRRYCIAVLREAAADGVSRRLHDSVRVGDLVEVATPRNHFPLAADAERHLLLAGGIGISPIMAMVAELQRRRAEFELHYCTRSPETTAFRDDLFLLAAQGHVHFHHDGGDPARGLDIAGLLRQYRPGTHLYYCGPAGMMAAAAAAAAHWPPEAVHREYFTGPPALRFEDDRPFQVRLARRGGLYEVGVGETITEALRRHGVAATTSCELGYCGACLTRYLSGEPDHRDQVLAEADRGHYVLICCARAKTPVLELDL